MATRFGDFGTVNDGLVEEHANGEIWAQTLWDLRTQGRQPDGALRGHWRAAAVARAASFLDARDAILESALVVGVSQATVWEVFAARGMGPDASSLTNPPTEDFDVPSDLPTPPAPTGSCMPPPNGGGGGTANPPPPPAGGNKGPTAAELAGALAADLKAIARGVKRLGLRKLVRRRGFTAAGLDALTAGRFAIQLNRKKLVLAKGARTVAGAGRYDVAVKLTRKGRRALRRARRITTTLTVRFTPSTGLPVKRATKARLKR